MHRISIQIPKRHRLVYFGSSGINLLKNYISESDAIVYRPPTVEINIWIALRSLIYGIPSQATYYRSFLAWTKPSWVVTREDNNETFYRTKHYLPNCKALSIQNGRRDSFSSQLGQNFWKALKRIAADGSTVDIVGTMGPPWSHYFSDALKGSGAKIIEIGSVKNNAVPTTVDSGENIERLVLISSFPNLGSHQDFDDYGDKTFGFWAGESFSYRSTFRIEAVLARLAAEYAQRHSLAFAVLGKRPSWQPSEERYFTQSIGGYPFTYIPLRTEASSYEAVRDTDIIVTSDSSLGYEFFARGLRVVFVSGRMTEAGKPEIPDCDFGYPEIQEKFGPFWTKSSSREEFERVVSFAHRATNQTWRESTLDLRTRLMIFDPENHLLCGLLNHLGIPNSGPSFWTNTPIPEK